MYICICKAVSESRLRRCVAEGAETLRDLREKTAVGTGCGKCVPHAYALLRETLEQNRSPAAHHEVAPRNRA